MACVWLQLEIVKKQAETLKYVKPDRLKEVRSEPGRHVTVFFWKVQLFHSATHVLLLLNQSLGNALQLLISSHTLCPPKIASTTAVDANDVKTHLLGHAAFESPNGFLVQVKDSLDKRGRTDHGSVTGCDRSSLTKVISDFGSNSVSLFHHVFHF